MNDDRCKKCGAPLAGDDTVRTCSRCALSLALFETEGGGIGPAATARPTGEAGLRIDRYVLVRKIGEGGMGEVWLARQEEPVRRQVALKIVKRGMDTEQFVARFENERQALAMMEHHAVAKVFDAGATPEGRPYFVMEYVDGLPITEYCDRERLETNERLALFREVCAGVEHAHQKAILHRDLKPSNVLVTLEDDRPVPKIIDFGVAKTLDARLTERTLFTELGVLVGTPEYMSPEQAAAGGRVVDTRTDVYSLGVLLYELLSGCLPFESHRLREAGYDGLCQVIREEEPPRPSLRISTLGDSLRDSAAHRRTDPGSLSRQLRGDLDWIVMKALEKDPERRYGSPAGLRADLARHLNHEPVLAGPPTAGYRVRKFARKHRVGVALASIAALALVAIVVLQAVNASRLTRERDRANREAVTANHVVEFLTGLFAEADPIQARGAEITAREILDRGRESIASGLEDEPRIQARLMNTMGWIDIQLGLYDDALDQFERSTELLRTSAGADHADTMRAEYSAAAALVRLGRIEEAEPMLRSTHERQLALLGAGHTDPWETANYLAQAIHGAGRREEALEWHLRSLEGFRAASGETSEATLTATANVALTLKDLGRLEEAEPYYHQALAGLRATFGEDHPETLGVQHNLGNLFLTQGRLEEAEETFRATLEARRRVLGERHPSVMDSMNDLATTLQNLERFEEVEPLRKLVLDQTRETFGNDHPNTLRAVNNMGSSLMAQGEFAEAEPYMLEVAEGARKFFGNEHPNALVVFGNLGQLYCRQEKFAKGEPILAEVAQTARRVLPEQHVITGFSIRKYGSCLAAAGRLDPAEELLLEAAGILEAGVGPEHLHTQDAFTALADLYERRGDDEEARQWRQRVPGS